jgi:carbon monoxide dehydrogenase subunit G
MKIEGTQKIAVARERVFAAMTDPAILQKCIPGCEQMQSTGANQYSAKLTAGVGPIKGVFTATVSLADITAPSFYKLVVEGKGQPGFVKGAGALNLAEDGEGTSIQYTGEINVGGLLASVGQRMIQGAANMMAGRFFSCLEGEARTYEPKPNRQD